MALSLVAPRRSRPPIDVRPNQRNGLWLILTLTWGMPGHTVSCGSARKTLRSLRSRCSHVSQPSFRDTPPGRPFFITQAASARASKKLQMACRGILLNRGSAHIHHMMECCLHSRHRSPTSREPSARFLRMLKIPANHVVHITTARVLLVDPVDVSMGFSIPAQAPSHDCAASIVDEDICIGDAAQALHNVCFSYQSFGSRAEPEPVGRGSESSILDDDSVDDVHVVVELRPLRS